MASPKSHPTFKTLGALAATGILGLTLTGCGGQAPSSAGADSESLHVGIFVDNAFGDGDFFDQAAVAIDPLTDEQGAVVKTYEGQLQAQNFAPLLQDAADTNDIVFVLGFEAIDALVSVAERNEDTTFVFVDGIVDSPNVISAEFRTAEGCFMAGALAAVVNQANASTTAGFIGGVNAPVVENCETGFTSGVSNVDPAMQVQGQYVGSFTDPSKGREVAIGLMNKGAFSMFAYAGLSGAGAFDAAKSGENIAPIGIVADKSSLAPGLVPGSLTMRVDTVIESLTEKIVDKSAKKGDQLSYGFKEGGWEMLYSDELVTADQIAQLDGLQEKLVAGEVKADGK